MDQGKTDSLESDHEDLEAVVQTGIRDQRLRVVGWGARHADTGTPGPHVHLRTNDPVLKTSQIPDLVDALKSWANGSTGCVRNGETWFTGDEPDDNDPAMIRQKKIDHLTLFDRLQAHVSEVAAIFLRSEDLHDASAAIAPLLGLDELEVEVRLNKLPTPEVHSPVLGGQRVGAAFWLDRSDPLRDKGMPFLVVGHYRRNS
jgi:hypothetical protein